MPCKNLTAFFLAMDYMYCVYMHIMCHPPGARHRRVEGLYFKQVEGAKLVTFSDVIRTVTQRGSPPPGGHGLPRQEQPKGAGEPQSAPNFH